MLSQQRLVETNYAPRQVLKKSLLTRGNGQGCRLFEIWGSQSVHLRGREAVAIRDSCLNSPLAKRAVVLYVPRRHHTRRKKQTASSVGNVVVVHRTAYLNQCCKPLESAWNPTDLHLPSSTFLTSYSSHVLSHRPRRSLLRSRHARSTPVKSLWSSATTERAPCWYDSFRYYHY